MQIPHELAAEFARDMDVIHALRQDDLSFCDLTDAYEEFNRRIHRIELLVEPATDSLLDYLKQHRFALREEIAALVAANKRAVA
ncbi:YdcH family protein [Oryzibacter oryziterrae]|uniref:YdcH family protein n=1 Tax=Oryzibacter oryziterrae TaxID=2766474 RepID=UPI001F2714EC|nr:DUF465 domain-containing protein [Oryzibacter oryziterrae]